MYLSAQKCFFEIEKMHFTVARMRPRVLSHAEKTRAVARMRKRVLCVYVTRKIAPLSDKKYGFLYRKCIVIY